MSTPKLPDINSRRKSADTMRKKGNAPAAAEGGGGKGDKALDPGTVNQLHRKELNRRRLHEQSEKERAAVLEKQRQEEEQQLRTDLDAHRVLVGERDHTIGTLQQQVAELRQLCLTLSEDKKKLETEVTQLKDQVKEQDKDHEETVDELTLTRKQLAELSEKSAAKDDELERLSTALSKHVQKTLFDNRDRRTEINEEERSLTTLVHAMDLKLKSALDKLIEDEQEFDRKQKMDLAQAFISKIDEYSEKYIQMLLEAKERARSLPDILMLGKMGHTMHSQLTAEMKQQLREFSKDELLILLDCLSFEDGVANFLNVELPHRKEHLLGEYSV
eukprot:TRINITY_DN95240_c0_g1_i1.p1 TRINITY_DN95240_c0_g1~~TRINITY_DN95240_c0_g1_i1.p1  ORF type:complete len:331 (-),score=35.77 TRINITY_DN95240_c0_g1_i1:257-1249(-)